MYNGVHRKTKGVKMNFKPKQYYVEVPKEEPPYEGEGIDVYHRKDDGKLGQHHIDTDSHKEAILTSKEALVADGDCLTKKAILAVIKGGKE